ncbi:hypothetical protein PsorP6_003633 [Peronosclerospora sorghi]|uniref:Uncharacterized protein n=1 Tax=Peronosclerospora sorghi TaxID=230839 RepID=A0ACC0VPF1_9STRA|nr:hypothetical protein PsorP6_003633 [Peronosclerospora sorghi]
MIKAMYHINEFLRSFSALHCPNQESTPISTLGGRLESSKLLVSAKSGPSPTLKFRILPVSWLLSISRSLKKFLNPLKFLDFPFLLIPPHIVVFLT